MDQDLERKIRERAYRLWEGEGRPEGREAEHWREAERQLMIEEDRGEPGGDVTAGDRTDLPPGSRPEPQPAVPADPLPADPLPADPVRNPELIAPGDDPMRPAVAGPAETPDNPAPPPEMPSDPAPQPEMPSPSPAPEMPPPMPTPAGNPVAAARKANRSGSRKGASAGA